MSQDLNVATLARGLYPIDESGRTSFLVTLPTNAHEEGHVVWLRKNFERWKCEMEKNPGVEIHHIDVNKKSGSIAIGMSIPGAIKISVHTNTTVLANARSSLRKSLATIVIEFYSPEFDYKDPLFDALNDYEYIPSIGVPSTFTKKEVELRFNEIKKRDVGLIMLLERIGVNFNEFKHSGKRISFVLQWRNFAKNSEVENLKNVLDAFLLGRGFTVTGWKIESIPPPL